MTHIDPALDEAYRATTYRAFVPGGSPIDLRVGEVSAALDALLATHGAHVWVFITAWNPGSKPLAADENDARHAQLVRIIGEGGWRCFEGAGIPARAEWQPEASVLVLGVAKEEAVALGRRFDQNAIVAGERGGRVGLIYCGA